MKVCKSKAKPKRANVHGLQTEHNRVESDDSESSNAIYFSANVKAVKKVVPPPEQPKTHSTHHADVAEQRLDV